MGKFSGMCLRILENSKLSIPFLNLNRLNRGQFFWYSGFFSDAQFLELTTTSFAELIAPRSLITTSEKKCISIAQYFVNANKGVNSRSAHLKRLLHPPHQRNCSFLDWVPINSFHVHTKNSPFSVKLAKSLFPLVLCGVFQHIYFTKFQLCGSTWIKFWLPRRTSFVKNVNV